MRYALVLILAACGGRPGVAEVADAGPAPACDLDAGNSDTGTGYTSAGCANDRLCMGLDAGAACVTAGNVYVGAGAMCWDGVVCSGDGGLCICPGGQSGDPCTDDFNCGDGSGACVHGVCL